MVKKHQTDNPLFKALQKKYEADISHATATLQIYFDNPVGIGEHPQHLEEIDKLFDKIATAQERLEVLEDFREQQKGEE